jgi:glycosyltransferase involved in cell wall biosynthesis
MKYPNIVFLRSNEYSYIDTYFENNKGKLLCNLNITSDINSLNKLYDANYHILVTYGPDVNEYIMNVNSIIAPRMNKRWLHFDKIDNIDSFNGSVNFCYTSLITSSLKHNYVESRPIFSIFTTCYKSYEKIYRAYDSVKKQTLKDWEWVIIDDSPDDEHFNFLRKLFKDDRRVRLYRRSENNGSIGNVKNEVISLCRGKYTIELDHDDEILPKVLEDSAKVFDEDDSVGFIYMDFVNIYEDGSNFNYGDYFALGYSGYYMVKYNNKWVYVASTPNINNITLFHIVAVPNHPRIWRLKTLLEMGSYSEFLPISDDYEVLLRTAVSTKMVKIHKLGYIQYMNNSGNNFSLIRNGEINRLCGNHLQPQCYEEYKITDYMIKHNAFEDYKYLNDKPIWKRTDFEHKYCNVIMNVDYIKQYCIVGISSLIENMDMIKQLYQDNSNDFLFLDNKISVEEMCKILDMNNFDRMKCYSMKDCTEKELINYFMLIYKSCKEYEIIL